MIVHLTKAPPPVCARCAGPADGTLTLVHRRGTSRAAEVVAIVRVGGEWIETRMPVPFCAACRRRHWAHRLGWGLGTAIVGVAGIALLASGAVGREGSVALRIATGVACLVGLVSPLFWFLSRDWGLGPVRLRGTGEVDVPPEVAAAWNLER